MESRSTPQTIVYRI